MNYNQLSEAQYSLLVKMALDFNAGVIALATAWKDGDKRRFAKQYRKMVKAYSDGIARVLDGSDNGAYKSFISKGE